MALRAVKLAHDIDEKEEQLEELREQRRTFNTREHELEDKINTARTQEERSQIEKEVGSFAEKRNTNQKKIETCEQELDEMREAMKKYEKLPPNPSITRKEGNYRNMGSNIVLRSTDSLYEKTKDKFDSEQKNLDLGKYVRGMVTGKWNNADQERAAMLTSGASSLIPAPLSSGILDKARNLSIFTAANVPTVIMDTNNLTVAKIKEDLKAAFKAEGEEAEESTPLELEGVTLKSKTIYGYAYVSREAVESAQNLSDILADSFGKAVAEGIDQGMLYGVYSGSEQQSYAPSGIFNDANINTVAASTNDYDDVIKAIGQIRNNNGVATTLAMNANAEQTLSLLKDNSGQYLTPPKAITDINQIVSNQLAYDTVTGSDMIVFDPNALLIGTQMGINVKISEDDDLCVKRNLMCFRILSMIDCVVLQPKHISRITGFGKEGE
ncbi:phage major capsid protein [Muricomes intestini]|jgi:HK97 family phage major capsid protein|uniref:phage major capsid protein n=1 Tax=Muricomes intestini TaxID=1796634 RepID=UPI002FE3A9AE